MKIAFVDIEATNLNASFGMMLSCCVKPLGCKTYCLHLRCSDISDIRLVRDSLGIIDRFDLIVGWYSKRYDIPFLRTRALKHGLSFLDPRIRHIDLYDTSKHKLNMHSNRLEAVCEFFGIRGKTKISSEAWNKAVKGDEKAMSEVIHHNKKDVEILEKVYNKLKRDVNTMSRIG